MTGIEDAMANGCEEPQVCTDCRHFREVCCEFFGYCDRELRGWGESEDPCYGDVAEWMCENVYDGEERTCARFA